MTAKQMWVTAIVGLLAANLIAMVILIVVANSETRSQVLPSYRGIVTKGDVEPR
jgi:hypothetical protein